MITGIMKVPFGVVSSSFVILLGMSRYDSAKLASGPGSGLSVINRGAFGPPFGVSGPAYCVINSHVPELNNGDVLPVILNP
jgi:hypothetical protein